MDELIKETDQLALCDKQIAQQSEKSTNDVTPVKNEEIPVEAILVNDDVCVEMCTKSNVSEKEDIQIEVATAKEVTTTKAESLEIEDRETATGVITDGEKEVGLDVEIITGKHTEITEEEPIVELEKSTEEVTSAEEEDDVGIETVSYNDGYGDDETNVSDEEREDGDGQEESSVTTSSKPVDDDDDKRNPQYIPKRGTFYEHDNRGDNDKKIGIETQPEKSTVKQAAKPESTHVSGRWIHDRYDETEQTPKSRMELISKYGYDIRNEEVAPKSRRRRRYTRGQAKYSRNWADESAYGKPVVKKPTVRTFKSLKTSSSLIRKRTRSREQKNVVIKSTTTATTTTTANTTTDDEVRRNDDFETAFINAEPPRTDNNTEDKNGHEEVTTPQQSQLQPQPSDSQPQSDRRPIEKKKVFYKATTVIPPSTSHRTRHVSSAPSLSSKLNQHYPQHNYIRNLRMRDELARGHGNSNGYYRGASSQPQRSRFNDSYDTGRSGSTRASYAEKNSSNGYNNRTSNSAAKQPQFHRRSVYPTSDEFDSQHTTTSTSSNGPVRKPGNEPASSSPSVPVDEQHHQDPRPMVKRYSSMRQKSASDTQSNVHSNVVITEGYDSSNENAETDKYYRPNDSAVSTVVFVVKRSPRENDYYNNNSNTNLNNSQSNGYRGHMGSGFNRHSYMQQMKQQQQQQRRPPVVQQHRQSMPPQITSPQLQPPYMLQPQQQPQTFIQTNAAASPQYFAASSTNRMAPAQILNYVEAAPPQTYSVPPPQLGQHQQFATYGTPHQQFNQNAPSQPNPEIYQTQQGGITYYSTQTQQIYDPNTLQSYQRRQKAAIPIVSPIEVPGLQQQPPQQIIYATHPVPTTTYIPEEQQSLPEQPTNLELYPVAVVPADDDATIAVNQ